MTISNITGVWFRIFLVCSLVFVAAANADARTSGQTRARVSRVIIHSIGGPMCRDGTVVYSPVDGDARRWIDYFNRHKVLGIHYVIDKSGRIEAGVPENQIANHAKGNNLDSIGIELVNRGDGIDQFTESQLGMLVAALRSIMQRWGIEKGSILSHSAVDDRYFECGGKMIKTKQDPGPAFPWERVLEALP